MAQKIISTRIPVEIDEEVEHLAKLDKIQKTIMIRKLLLIGLQELKERYSLELYRKGKVTLWKAAELAGLSIWEMLDKVKEEKIPLKYDLDDAKRDLKLVSNW